jgi:molecular chaperone DnaK
MKYVGIDLGTTNSAISTYDGSEVVLFKSSEQHDVTPSAIYVDRRGNKYVGARAYNNAALDPANAALLFKRQMGTSTRFPIPNLGHELTAEECSAEILRAVYGYLPDAVRGASETGAVITVPAAFDQMQKDATLAAAEAANIGRVALMQEPVAAVMSVMRKRRADGVFLIYDIGGGTLDIAIAQSIAGRVNLLAHGGIAMCGGRDFDRMIVDSVVQPWLHTNFDLTPGLEPADQKRLYRLAAWAAEKAKIELSQRDGTVISLSEAELNRRDARGVDLYLDAPLDRATFDALIAEQITTSIDAARATLAKAGLEPADVERVVFVGGPTFYAPLRDRVAFELGIAASTEVNPMTAVAEGAAIFAESIDWSLASRARKSGRGQLAAAPLSITFHYATRTPGETARVAVELTAEATAGAEFQVDCIDTGWSSGRLPLRRGAYADLPLVQWGENRFKARVFDPVGGPLPLKDDRIAITRTAATIDGIPASHSIGVEVRERVGGHATLDYLVREGDLLPKKGVHTYKAESTLRPGEARAINFRLYEGEIRDPLTDNRFIGVFSIRGSDLGDRPIPAGADLICEFEVLDSGNIVLQVNVPAAQGSFNSARNFYSRQEGQIDFGKAGQMLKDDCEQVTHRLDQLSGRVSDHDLRSAKDRISKAGALAGDDDPERAKQASEYIQEAKRHLAEARIRNLQTIREVDLEATAGLFNAVARELAKPGEVETFDALARAAEAVIAKPDGKFETLLDDMRSTIYLILWRQPEFLRDRLEHLARSPHLFMDDNAYSALIARGQRAVAHDDIDALRSVLFELDNIRLGSTDEADFSLAANIVKAS